MRNAKLILILVALGFLTTLIEVRFLHRGVVREYAAAWIPTVSSAVAATASLAALGGGLSRRISGGVLAVVALAGLLGVYYHTKFRPSAFLRLFEPSPTVARADDGHEREAEHEEEGDEEQPPALAPLGITGLALIGAAAAFGRNGDRT
ncbi:MAG: hypothetical protein ACK41F_04075 [Fimbriimonadaceae bacterium]